MDILKIVIFVCIFIVTIYSVVKLISKAWHSGYIEEIEKNIKLEGEKDEFKE